MNPPKRYLVTSALPYANGPLHIGHLAGAYLSADIYVRFLRMMGKDVLFVCGSDEHGAAITIRAQKDNTTPQEIVDKYHQMFKDTFEKIGISFDIYHRTSSPIHHKTSQDFFRGLHDKGEFTEAETEQYFDEASNQFLADRYIKGTCPKCGFEEAYGDQCENCGSSLSPTELINPVSSITGAVPKLKKTTHWYLPLEKYETWLKKWINTGEVDNHQQHDPEEWKKHVLGQCNSWLDSGLQPRSMTRDLDWGVDVPQEIPGAEGKKLYVWMDAPIGYISATKQWAKDNGKDWEQYWKDEDTALINFIGKDNIVFHCLIFPAILKAMGGYILPQNVPANQFMNLEGKKISTSRNWAVWVHEYVKDFEGREDELRYNMIKNMPELKDSEFTWKGYQETNNNELVNNLANFVNRVLVLTDKYFEGVVPDFDPELPIESATGEDMPGFYDSELLDLFDSLDEMRQLITTFDFRGGLRKLMEISSAGNQLLQFNEPWKLIKADPETVKVVINLAIQYVACLSVAMHPFLPFTSEKLRKMLALDPIKKNSEWLDMMNLLCEGEPIIDAGHSLGKSAHLFSRIDDSVIQKEIDKLHHSSNDLIEQSGETAPESDSLKSQIEYNDFAKMDMRTGTILSAEKVEKADKLLKLSVDLGFEKRVVVSGIAEQFKTDEIVGKKVVLLANLAPRKIRGVHSQGMILMAEDGNGNLSFVAPDKEWENGSVIS